MPLLAAVGVSDDELLHLFAPDRRDEATAWRELSR